MAWTADISIKEDLNPGWSMVELRVEASSLEEAHKQTARLFETIAGDRGVLIRVGPEADHYRDFLSKKDYYRGYARFLLSDEKGERQDSSYAVRRIPVVEA